MTDTIYRWWTMRRFTILRVAIFVMSALAVLKIGSELQRLLFQSNHQGAVDLRLFHRWALAWFAGKDVYHDKLGCAYPPASMLFFKVLGFGWLSENATRWFWAASLFVFTVSLTKTAIIESLADTRLEQVFVALMVLSMNATGVTIGNGQLTIHVLYFLTAAILFLDRNPRWKPGTGLALAALLITLIKPTMAAPFFILLLMRRNGFLPLCIIGIGYVAATILAAQFQQQSFFTLLKDSLAFSDNISKHGGYGNIHNWLRAAGLVHLHLYAAFAMLAVFTWWLFCNRRSDIWLLLGVTAIMARLWTYHRVYDDLLILLPMIALFRISKSNEATQSIQVQSGILLAVTVIAMMAPARLEVLPFPWHLPFTVGHTVLWIVIGVFLARTHSRYFGPTLNNLQSNRALD